MTTVMQGPWLRKILRYAQDDTLKDVKSLSRYIYISIIDQTKDFSGKNMYYQSFGVYLSAYLAPVIFNKRNKK